MTYYSPITGKSYEYEVSPPESPEELARQAKMTPDELREYARQQNELHKQSVAAPLQNPSPASTANLPSLPNSLTSEGPIHQRLQMTREQIQDPIRIDRVVCDLECLCRQWRAQSGSNDFGTRLSQLGPSSDPVLRLVVAHQEGMERAIGSLRAAAEKAYWENPQFYRLVFGTLLPDEFRQYVDELAYTKNINPTAADDLNVFFRRVRNQRELVSRQGCIGMPIGIRPLDEALGGVRGLTLVTGHKGAGKTTLGLSLVVETLKSQSDTAALIYSLDLPKSTVLLRILSREAGISIRKLMSAAEFNERERQNITDAEDVLRRLCQRLRVIERDYSCEDIQSNQDGQTRIRRGLSLQHLMNDCSRLLQQTGARQLLIFIDMLSKWDLPGYIAPQTDPDHYRLDTLDQLRKWSYHSNRPEGFVVFATSELRKDPGKEMSIDDLKGDGRLGSDADNVLLLSSLKKAKDLSDEPVPVKLRIEKTRDGGQLGDIRLLFNHVLNRFEEAPVESKSGRTTYRAVMPTTIDPLAT